MFSYPHPIDAFILTVEIIFAHPGILQAELISRFKEVHDIVHINVGTRTHRWQDVLIFKLLVFGSVHGMQNNAFVLNRTAQIYLELPARTTLQSRLPFCAMLAPTVSLPMPFEDETHVESWLLEKIPSFEFPDWCCQPAQKEAFLKFLGVYQKQLSHRIQELSPLVLRVCLNAAGLKSAENIYLFCKSRPPILVINGPCDDVQADVDRCSGDVDVIDIGSMDHQQLLTVLRRVLPNPGSLW